MPLDQIENQGHTYLLSVLDFIPQQAVPPIISDLVSGIFKNSFTRRAWHLIPTLVLIIKAHAVVCAPLYFSLR